MQMNHKRALAEMAQQCKNEVEQSKIECNKKINQIVNQILMQIDIESDKRVEQIQCQHEEEIKVLEEEKQKFDIELNILKDIVKKQSSENAIIHQEHTKRVKCPNCGSLT